MGFFENAQILLCFGLAFTKSQNCQTEITFSKTLLKMPHYICVGTKPKLFMETLKSQPPSPPCNLSGWEDQTTFEINNHVGQWTCYCKQQWTKPTVLINQSWIVCKLKINMTKTTYRPLFICFSFGPVDRDIEAGNQNFNWQDSPGKLLKTTCVAQFFENVWFGKNLSPCKQLLIELHPKIIFIFCKLSNKQLKQIDVVNSISWRWAFR